MQGYKNLKKRVDQDFANKVAEAAPRIQKAMKAQRSNSEGKGSLPTGKTVTSAQSGAGKGDKRDYNMPAMAQRSNISEKRSKGGADGVVRKASPSAPASKQAAPAQHTKKPIPAGQGYAGSVGNWNTGGQKVKGNYSAVKSGLYKK